MGPLVLKTLFLIQDIVKYSNDLVGSTRKIIVVILQIWPDQYGQQHTLLHKIATLIHNASLCAHPKAKM